MADGQPFDRYARRVINPDSNACLLYGAGTTDAGRLPWRSVEKVLNRAYPLTVHCPPTVAAEDDGSADCVCRWVARESIGLESCARVEVQADDVAACAGAEWGEACR